MQEMNLKMSLAFVLAIFSVLMMKPAWAETTEDVTRNEQRALIEKVAKGQIQIVNTFPVSNELQGFVVKTAAGRDVILYVNQKATYLFAGTIVTQDGVDLTAQYTDQYIHAAVASRAHTAVEKTEWFVEGKDSAPHKLYVIADPMCGYCKKQYALLKPLIDQGDLQVRWVMVGYLREESAGIAAYILMGKTAEEKIERLAKHEKTGTVKPLMQDPADLVKNAVFSAVGKNTAFFDEFSPYFVGTPTFLFVNDQHQPQFYPGMIIEEKMKAVFSHISNSWSL